MKIKFILIISILLLPINLKPINLSKIFGGVGLMVSAGLLKSFSDEYKNNYENYEYLNNKPEYNNIKRDHYRTKQGQIIYKKDILREINMGRAKIAASIILSVISGYLLIKK